MKKRRKGCTFPENNVNHVQTIYIDLKIFLKRGKCQINNTKLFWHKSWYKIYLSFICRQAYILTLINQIHHVIKLHSFVVQII